MPLELTYGPGGKTLSYIRYNEVRSGSGRGGRWGRDAPARAAARGARWTAAAATMGYIRTSPATLR
eukprot:6198220-Pleurochrysis_carterae.AAC.1